MKTPTTDRWDMQWWFPEAPDPARPKWFLFLWLAGICLTPVAFFGLVAWLI